VDEAQQPSGPARILEPDALGVRPYRREQLRMPHRGATWSNMDAPSPDSDGKVAYDRQNDREPDRISVGDVVASELESPLPRLIGPRGVPHEHAFYFAANGANLSEPQKGGSTMSRFQATIAALVICIVISIDDPAAAENVLRFRGMDATAATMDPHAYATPENRAATKQVYEALLDVDSNLAIVPQLALAWRL
jgi:hypothetical protein